jgi:hypothetical protein
MTRKDAELLLDLEVKLLQAKTKHPTFPGNPKDGISIISEEFLELNEALLNLNRGVNDEKAKEQLIEEAYHVAVTALRFIQQVKK